MRSAVERLIDHLGDRLKRRQARSACLVSVPGEQPEPVNSEGGDGDQDASRNPPTTTPIKRMKRAAAISETNPMRAIPSQPNDTLGRPGPVNGTLSPCSWSGALPARGPAGAIWTEVSQR